MNSRCLTISWATNAAVLQDSGLARATSYSMLVTVWALRFIWPLYAHRLTEEAHTRCLLCATNNRD